MEPLRPPAAPQPPTHHGHLVQPLEVGLPAAAQPHQQHGHGPDQHSHKEADDHHHSGVGFGGGLCCGVRWAPRHTAVPTWVPVSHPTYRQPTAPWNKGGAQNTSPKWMGRDFGWSKGTEASSLWDLHPLQAQPPNQENSGTPMGTGIHGSTQRHLSTSSPCAQHGKGQQPCAAPPPPHPKSHPMELTWAASPKQLRSAGAESRGSARSGAGGGHSRAGRGGGLPRRGRGQRCAWGPRVVGH